LSVAPKRWMKATPLKRASGPGPNRPIGFLGGRRSTVSVNGCRSARRGNRRSTSAVYILRVIGKRPSGVGCGGALPLAIRTRQGGALRRSQGRPGVCTRCEPHHREGDSNVIRAFCCGLPQRHFALGHAIASRMSMAEECCDPSYLDVMRALGCDTPRMTCPACRGLGQIERMR
jgi:hypothetical protein